MKRLESAYVAQNPQLGSYVLVVAYVTRSTLCATLQLVHGSPYRPAGGCMLALQLTYLVKTDSRLLLRPLVQCQLRLK
jgi:hypothetical protein